MRTIVCAAALVCAALAAPRADACGNGVEIEIDPRIDLVMSANAALDKDDPALAAKRALAAFPKLRTSALDNGLRGKAMRAMAVAIVRLDGAVTAADFRADDRDGNYVWAVRVLRGISIKRATDPAALTDLGEALAARSATRAEARKILELLAPRDLITNAYGWAALARARIAAGDTAGRADAVAHCAKMARTIAVCKVRGDAPEEKAKS
jgi:hypothetical protein